MADEKSISKEIIFEVGLRFRGSPAQFEKVQKLIGELRVAGGIIVDGRTDMMHPRPIPWPGFPPKPDIFPPVRLKKLTEGMHQIKVLEGINGGIRNPHLHLGNNVVFLDRERFREYVGATAMTLAEELTDALDHMETMEALTGLVPR